MKKKLLILMLLLLFNTATADSIIAKKDNVPLQISTTSSQVLALIPLDTQLEKLETDGQYYKVNYNGQDGYVYKSNMGRVGVSSKEPVIDTPYKNEQAQFGNEKTRSSNVISNTLYIDGKARINSLIYTPQNADEDLPLVIYIHGKGECVDDINVLAKSNSLPKYLITGSISPNAIILMPQSSNEGMFSVNSESGAAFRCLINKVVETYNVDRDKISIVGFSMGCRTVVYTGGSYPDTFSAAVLISGQRTGEPYMTGLAKIPVRGYCGSYDEKNTCVHVIEEINKRNGKAEFYEIPGAEHGGTPRKVFFDYKLLDWMLQQSK